MNLRYDFRKYLEHRFKQYDWTHYDEALSLRDAYHTILDEFSENFQTASNPPALVL